MADNELARKLIIKAARRYSADRHDTRYKSLLAQTRLLAFAEVAADVLGICTAPAGFVTAITETVNAHPSPYAVGRQRDAAAKARQEWETLTVEAVMKSLDRY